LDSRSPYDEDDNLVIVDGGCDVNLPFLLPFLKALSDAEKTGEKQVIVLFDYTAQDKNQYNEDLPDFIFMLEWLNLHRYIASVDPEGKVKEMNPEILSSIIGELQNQQHNKVQKVKINDKLLLINIPFTGKNRGRKLIFDYPTIVKLAFAKSWSVSEMETFSEEYLPFLEEIKDEVEEAVNGFA
jgi:hypothetical protein